MADNPRLEIVVSGDTAGTATGPPQPIGRPQEPPQAPQPSEPRAFQQPKGRDELNAENVARFAAERTDLLEKIKSREAKQQRDKEAGVDPDDFDAAGTKKEVEALRRDLETVDEVLGMLGATAEQVAPKVRKATEAIGADKTSGASGAAPTAGGVEPQKASRPHIAPSTDREEPMPLGGRPPLPEWKSSRRERGWSQTLAEAQKARARRRRTRTRYQQHRNYHADRLTKPLRTGANALQFAGTFAVRGGRYAQYGSLALRGAGRVAQNRIASGGGGAGVIVALGIAGATAATALTLVAGAAYKLNDWMEQSVQRYGWYGARTAAERGITMGEGIVRDIQRAQRLDDVLSKYVRASFELDQQWEDFKAKLLTQFGPTLNSFIEWMAKKTGEAAATGYDLWGNLGRSFDQTGDALGKIIQGIEVGDFAGVAKAFKAWVDADVRDKKLLQDEASKAKAKADAEAFMGDLTLAIPALGLPAGWGGANRQPRLPRRVRRRVNQVAGPGVPGAVQDPVTGKWFWDPLRVRVHQLP